MDNRPINDYLGPEQSDEHSQRWGAIEHHVNEIDGHAQALNIAPHDLFKKFTHPDYTGPQGLNWTKLKQEHKEEQLAAKLK